MKQPGETSTPTGDITSKASSAENCPFCKGLGYVRNDVPVDHPNFGQLVPCACQLAELSQRRLLALRTLSNLDLMERMTFETFEPEGHGLPPDKQANLRWAYTEAKEFADNPRGWLVLKGGYGCGKTHLAAAIANACIEHGQAVLFITVPDLLDHLRAAFSPASSSRYDSRFDEVRTVPVLILDDLGTESSTPWAQEKLFQILNYRYNARQPTVITTNHALEDIPLRIRSRLADADLTRIVSIVAPDYRRAGVPSDQLDLSTLRLHSRQTFDNFSTREGEKLSREQIESLAAALQMARTFAAEPRDWLLFRGPYGCGKTHLAAAIANYRVEQGYPAIFVLVPDLLDHLRETFNPQSAISFHKQFDEVRRAPLLILDDLGTESATPWAREKLYQLFDYRYNARLPTVITTAEHLTDLDQRLVTRMSDPTVCTEVVIRANAYHEDPSARRQAAPRGRKRQ